MLNLGRNFSGMSTANGGDAEGMTGFSSQFSWTRSPLWQGWGSSLIVHAMAIGLAFLLTANVKPPPQKESFRWEVSLVSPPPSPEPQVQRVTKSSPTPVNKPVLQQRPVRQQQPITRRVAKRQPQTRRAVQPIVRPQRLQAAASVQQRAPVKTESPMPRTIEALAHTPSPRIARQREMTKPVRQSARPVAHAVPATLRQTRNTSAPTKIRQTAISAPPATSRSVARESIVAQAQPANVARRQTSHTPVIKNQGKAVSVTAQAHSAPVVQKDSSRVATPARRQVTPKAVPVQTHLVPQVTPAAKESTALEGISKPVRTVAVRKDRPNHVATVSRQETFVTSRPVKTREAFIAHRAIDTKSSSTVRATPVEKRVAKEEKAVNNVTALPPRTLVRNAPVMRPMAVVPQEAPTTKKSATNGLSPEVLAFLKLLRLEIERARVYPSHARRMGLEGTTKVRFALLPNGELKSLKVAEPSGYAVLDAAALATVKKVLPFHPPDAVELEGLSIEVPIRFRLR